jgi:hypothetical protein
MISSTGGVVEPMGFRSRAYRGDGGSSPRIAASLVRSGARVAALIARDQPTYFDQGSDFGGGGSDYEGRSGGGWGSGGVWASNPFWKPSS